MGNIWKFPYLAGENGGGTFVLVYLVCVALIGLPVMCSEMLIGRQTRRNIINAMGKIELLSGPSPVRYVLSLLALAMGAIFWTLEAWLLVAAAIFAAWAFAKRGFAAMGWVCTAVALVILSYYAVVGGWIIEYIWRSITGALVETTPAAAGDAVRVASDAGKSFAAYSASPGRVLIGFTLFMTLTGVIILGGIQAGIERMSKILMPALFILLLVVIGRSVTLPGAWEGVVFLFKPTAAAFTPKVVMMALGQAFFSLSLGMAITVTYGSYLHKEHNILRAAGWVGILDTFAALLSGLAIFPAVFAIGLKPSAGPGLIFGALPATFNEMWLGPVWATCFFSMLLIAATTSSVSLMECGATVLIERLRKRHRRCSRKVAVLITVAFCTVLGLLAVFSTADWSNIPTVGKGAQLLMGRLADNSWFDLLDTFTSNWCLPFAAMAVVLLVGWVWTPRRAAPNLLASGEGSTFPRWLLTLWGISVRWVAPIALLLLFLNFAGILRFS